VGPPIGGRLAQAAQGSAEPPVGRNAGAPLGLLDTWTSADFRSPGNQKTFFDYVCIYPRVGEEFERERERIERGYTHIIKIRFLINFQCFSGDFVAYFDSPSFDFALVPPSSHLPYARPEL